MKCLNITVMSTLIAEIQREVMNASVFLVSMEMVSCVTVSIFAISSNIHWQPHCLFIIKTHQHRPPSRFVYLSTSPLLVSTFFLP